MVAILIIFNQYLVYNQVFGRVKALTSMYKLKCQKCYIKNENVITDYTIIFFCGLAFCRKFNINVAL